MNIDERLEKLAERTGALTHSVELLASMQKDTEKQIRRLGKYIRGVSQIVLDHEAPNGWLKATKKNRMKDS